MKDSQFGFGGSKNYLERLQPKPEIINSGLQMLSQARVTHTSECSKRPVFADSPQLKPPKKILNELIWFSNNSKRENSYSSVAPQI
jgi:hypothetical protein